MNKILFVIGLSKSGGAEKRAIRIAQLLKEKYETRVFAFSGEKNDSIDYVFKKTYLEYKKFSVHQRIKALRNYIEKEQPDIVFSFMRHIDFFTTRALKPKRFRNIIHIVSVVYPFFSFKNKLLANYSFKRADAIFYQCEDQKKFIKCYKNSFVLPNPIEIKPIIEKNIRFRFMSCGRLEDQKNFELQIKGFSLISKSFPSSSLDIYGNGSKKEELSKLIETEGLNQKVFIHDYTDSIDDEYAKHDIFLFTSKAEGFPNALAEAMANNLICFTTHFFTGCDELIKNNETGFVCYERTPEAFAKIVIDYLSDYDSCKNVAKLGYNHVKLLCDSTKFCEKMFLELEKLIKW